MRSWSSFVFGSTAMWITGSGNVIDSRTSGCEASHSVSPVVVIFNPIAAIPPAATSGTSSRWFACICMMRLTRSVFSRVELYTLDPETNRPEYTRK